jgi:asparagine synthetase B (glutamine-hydrolysing)
MGSQPQAASVAEERGETSPWALVFGAQPSEPPAGASTHRWTLPTRIVQLHVRGEAWPDIGEHAGHHVCFDGELYNASDLRRQLDAANTTTPADLVARAVSRWGLDAPLHLKGIFAMASWSSSSDRVLLARDPAGTYPLFFTEAGEHIACAVEVGSLQLLPWVSSAINRLALTDHLSHRWLSWHETHLTDISRVPAGFVVSWEKSRRSMRRYWYPADPSGHIDWVREDELDQFHVHFDEAVRRCVDQGRTGIFLSGGFDSVSIAAAATDLVSRRGGARPIAASLTFPDPSCNEQPVQQRVADSLGMHQIVVRLEDAVAPVGLIQAGIDINRTSSLPMTHAWRPAYRALGDAARKAGCRIVIGGEGGDEWLTVAPEYMADLIRGGDIRSLAGMVSTVLKSFDLSRTSLVYSMLWTHGLRLLLASWGRAAAKSVAPGTMARRRLAQLERRSPEWVVPDPDLQRALRERMERWTEASLQEPEPSGPYGFYLATFPHSFLHPLRSLDLEETFSSRRRTGLRELQPFWDPDLIQFLCRIHPRVLERGGRTKGLVREQVAKRFPGLGFETHRKISASRFFSETVAREAPRAWDRLRGVPTLARLGILDARKAEAAARADVGNIVRSGNCRVWEMLTLEAWATAHA